MTALVALIRDTLVPVREFLEDSDGHLKTAEIGKAEDRCDHGVSHPLLAENGAAGFHFSLDWHPFVGCKSTAGQAPSLFNLLDTHDLINFLSILMVVIVASHNAADGVLAHPVSRVGHIAQVPVLLQLLLHLIYKY